MKSKIDNNCIFTILVVLFNLIAAFAEESGKEDFGINNPSEEYVNVFQNIPMLFEYLLETLEKKPEILEKNDVTVFKRSIDLETDDTNGNYAKSDKSAAVSSLSDNGDDTLIYEETVYVGLTESVVFSLTPEEVAEQAMKVERILDEHNNSNK